MTSSPDFDLEQIIGGELRPLSNSPMSSTPRYPVSSLGAPSQRASIFPDLAQKYASAPSEREKLIALAASPITVTPQQIREYEASKASSSGKGLEEFMEFISSPPRTTRASPPRASPRMGTPSAPSGGVLFTEENELVPLGPRPSRVRSYMSRPTRSSTVRRQLFPSPVERQTQLERFRASLASSKAHKEGELEACAKCELAKEEIMGKYGHSMPSESAPMISSRRPLWSRTLSPSRRAPSMSRSLSPSRRTATSAVLIPGTGSRVAGDKGRRTLMAVYSGDIEEYQGHVGERYEKDGVNHYYIDGKPVSREEFIQHGGWLR